MSKSKRTPAERSAELRALLNCGPTQRTTEAAKAVLAERDALRVKVADLERALKLAWEGGARAAE